MNPATHRNRDNTEEHVEDAGGEEQTPRVMGLRQVMRYNWRRVLSRVWDNYMRDEVALLAPGVAFFFFLALIPLGVVAVALLGLFTDPQTIQEQFGQLLHPLPDDAETFVRNQLTRIASTADSSLGWATALGLAVSLWSASTGSRALMSAFNVIYGEKERRSFLKGRLIAAVITLVMILMVGLFFVLVAVTPVVLNFVRLESFAGELLKWGRWPVLVGLMLVSVALLSRYAPCRSRPQLRWVSVGAVLSSVLWAAVSAGLSFYVANFANYDKTYGSLAGIVLLMFWLYLTISAILIGGIFNAELEAEARRQPVAECKR